MSRFIGCAVVLAAVLVCHPAVSQNAPSVAEQALGLEVMACVQSRVALRAEIISLKAPPVSGEEPAAAPRQMRSPRSGPPVPPPADAPVDSKLPVAP